MTEVKVVWISRHELLPENKQILSKAFGNWILVEWVRYTITPEDIKVLVEKHKDAKFVVVLPPNLLAEFLRFTKEVFTPVGLEKIVRIVIETKRVV